MSDKWANKYSQCQNCQTVRRRHKAKGYCNKCYSIFKRLENAKYWTLSSPSSLKGYPKEKRYRTEEYFVTIKKGYIHQLGDRLKQIASQEMTLKRQASGHDIEYEIRHIGNLCGVNGRLLFEHSADEFERWLDNDQKNFLFKKLHLITENIRWKGIDWWKLFKDGHKKN